MHLRRGCHFLIHTSSPLMPIFNKNLCRHKLWKLSNYGFNIMIFMLWLVWDVLQHTSTVNFWWKWAWRRCPNDIKWYPHLKCMSIIPCPPVSQHKAMIMVNWICVEFRAQSKFIFEVFKDGKFQSFLHIQKKNWFKMNYLA